MTETYAYPQHDLVVSDNVVLEGPVGGITLKEHIALSVLPTLMEMHPGLTRTSLLRIAFEYADEFIAFSNHVND